MMNKRKWIYSTVIILSLLTLLTLSTREQGLAQVNPTPTPQTCPPVQKLPPSDEKTIKEMAEEALLDLRSYTDVEWTISLIRGMNDWGIVELSPVVAGNNVPGDGDILLAHFEDGKWKVAHPYSPEFNDWLRIVPDELLMPFPERGIFRMQSYGSSSGIYKLPYECGKSAYVSRAGSDHNNAVDFLINGVSGGNDVVVAAADGQVYAVVENRTACCCNSSYKSNYVIIKHPNGEYSYYVHLKAYSVVVSVGQWVKQGDVIAREGDVGYTCSSSGGRCRTRYCGSRSDYPYCCEHLHFEVRDRGDWRGNRLNPRFSDVPGYYVHSGGTYTSGNCPDSEPPTTSIALYGTQGSNNWYRSEVRVSLSATDNSGGSGVKLIQYQLNNGNWQSINGSSTSFTVSEDGSYTLRYRAQDNAGNWEDIHHTWFGIDTTPPSTSVSLAGTLGTNNWYRSEVRVSLSATDNSGGSGVKLIQYQLNNGDWQSINGSSTSFTVSEDGSYTLRYKAQDDSGNWGTTHYTWFGVDTISPTLAMHIADGDIAHQSTVVLDLSAADTGSGAAEVRVSNNAIFWSDWQPYADRIPWTLPALDRHTLNVYVQVRDYAGNESPVVSDAVTLDLYPLAPHSTDYRLCNDILNAGGTVRLTSTDYILNSSFGQPLVERGDILGLSGCRPIARPTYKPLSRIRSVVAAEGNWLTAADYRLIGTLGQPLATGASAHIGGNYLLSSGFWGYNASLPATQSYEVYLPLVLRNR